MLLPGAAGCCLRVLLLEWCGRFGGHAGAAALECRCFGVLPRAPVISVISNRKNISIFLMFENRKTITSYPITSYPITSSPISSYPITKQQFS